MNSQAKEVVFTCFYVPSCSIVYHARIPIGFPTSQHLAMLAKWFHGSAWRVALGRCRVPTAPMPTAPVALRRGFAEVYRQQLLDGNEEILTKAGGEVM